MNMSTKFSYISYQIISHRVFIKEKLLYAHLHILTCIAAIHYIILSIYIYIYTFQYLYISNPNTHCPVAQLHNIYQYVNCSINEYILNLHTHLHPHKQHTHACTHVHLTQGHIFEFRKACTSAYLNLNLLTRTRLIESSYTH